MTTQGRFVSGANIYDLTDNGWHILTDFDPPAMQYAPLLATGTPSPDYPGGELVEENIGDVTFNLPLGYRGGSASAARIGLETFIRRGVASKNLQLQLREDRAFDITPLWGQWGAWLTYEVIHAGSLVLDGRTWEIKNGQFATLTVTAKPAVTGQAQQIANAKGNVAESWGANGLSEGVTIPASSHLKLPAAAVNESGGMVVVAWESGGDPGGINDLVVFHNGEVGIWWDPINKYWEAFANSTAAHGSATTFPASGTLCVFHLDYTVGTGTAAAYLNGVKFATLNSVAFSAAATYIGTNTSGGAPIGGVFKFFATYATAMSGTEVAADYSDIVAALSAGPSPSPIPYAITLTGVGQLNNATDASGSTGAPHQNYAWLAGIPGSLPAKMELRLTPSVLGSVCKRLAVSLLDYDDIFAPEVGGVLYEDVGGTANAGSSSGSYTSTTIDTTFTLQLDTDQADAVYRRLQGREVAMYARLQSGATGAFQIKLAIIVGSTIISAAKNVATAAAFRMVRTPFLALPKQAAPEIADTAESSIQLYAGRSTGSGAALFDWGMVMPRPLVEVDTSAVGALTVVIYENTANRAGGSETVWATLPRKGDVLRPSPHRYNLLALVMGDETVDPLVTWYATATITVTPRWSVI